ncbi:MAG: alpha/beta hydrolase [Propionibacteriales bacterium]|nr:alpha/beta hydrolase [Propionibacteriales bacterium]
MSAPFGRLPTRFEPASGDTGKVAIILPGSGYSPAFPLLEFGRQALMQHGWTVQQVWWDSESFDDLDRARLWVDAQAEAAVTAEKDAERLLLMGKSLGTLAAEVAVRHDLPAVWFTPLLNAAIAADAHRRATRPMLLVGGTADKSWDGALAAQLSDFVLEIPDATHFMDLPDDAVRTAEILVEVVRAVDAFLTRLG